jgi:electron transfer flavoprotein beta subunit
MRILVPLKRVPDPDTKIRVRADGSGIETEGVSFVINPFDEIALEEALRLRESYTDDVEAARLRATPAHSARGVTSPATSVKESIEEIVVVTIGGPETTEQLRRGLAMGADRAIRVDESRPLEPLVVAKLLAALVGAEAPDLVLMGKQAIDDDCNQTGQMLAALLKWPQATFASRIEVLDGGARLRVAREVDGGIERVIVRLPAVVTTDLRLNEPRYVALPGIMRAKSKPLSETSPAALGVETTARTRTLSLVPPPRRSRGQRVADAAELVRRLREEAKVL